MIQPLRALDAISEDQSSVLSNHIEHLTIACDSSSKEYHALFLSPSPLALTYGHACTYTYSHRHIQIHIHTHVSIYIHIQIDIQYAHTYIHAYTYIHTLVKNKNKSSQNKRINLRRVTWQRWGNVASIKIKTRQVVTAYTLNPGIQEVEAGGSL